MDGPGFRFDDHLGVRVLRLRSDDGTNRLTRGCALALTDNVKALAPEKKALVVAGNDRFFSARSELEKISALDPPAACEFSKMGPALMSAIDHFPAPVYAAISGYCMGGGLDLALACHHRIASPHAAFGHRGAALGADQGLGWNSPAASSDRQSARPGDVRSSGNNHGSPGVADGTGGRNCCRSIGGGGVAILQ